ncbi:MAG TPA: type II secretion system protein [Candidatus Paceibacterota bacterium]
MSILNKQKAFTLIELLVVIAIISILTGIILSNLSGAKSKARDSKRVSDVAQLQLALELFFDRCNRYPVVSSGLPNIDDGDTTLGDEDGSNDCPSDIRLSTFISQIPTSPSPGVYTYGVNATPATDYVLMVSLENNSILLDDIDTNPLYGINCADQNQNYCVVPK